MSLSRDIAERFMRAALEQASQGVGRTSPNPAVGAVLVKGGKVISRGFHRRAGAPHAEVVAIRDAGARARGADLYTTLEPCDHWGRTPPCTKAILEAGIRRVVYASSDPNPLVNGRGIGRLKRAGVQVMPGVLEREADELNAAFFKWVVRGMPYVTAKAAVTLDGKIASASGDSKWITGEPARRRVHELRNRVDAVLVGANTVRADDPRLTTRLSGGRGRDPVRVVVDSKLRLDRTRTVFTQRSAARTIVATTLAADSPRARRFSSTGIEVWSLPSREGQVDLRALLKRLGAAGMVHVLAEGGAQMFSSLLRQRLVDELWIFVAPKLVGAKGLTWTGELGVRGMKQALELGELQAESVGRDLLLRCRLPRR